MIIMMLILNIMKWQNYYHDASSMIITIIKMRIWRWLSAEQTFQIFSADDQNHHLGSNNHSMSGCRFATNIPQIFHIYSTNISQIFHKYSPNIPHIFQIYSTNIPQMLICIQICFNPGTFPSKCTEICVDLLRDLSCVSIKLYRNQFQRSQPVATDAVVFIPLGYYIGTNIFMGTLWQTFSRIWECFHRNTSIYMLTYNQERLPK